MVYCLYFGVVPSVSFHLFYHFRLVPHSGNAMIMPQKFYSEISEQKSQSPLYDYSI